jgi:hypothetical protein
MTQYPTILLAAFLCLSACDEAAQHAPATPAPSTTATLEGAAVTDPRSVPPAFRAVWTVSDCDEPYETLEIAAASITVEKSRFRYRLINGGQALFDVRSGLTRNRCPAP